MGIRKNIPPKESKLFTGFTIVIECMTGIIGFCLHCGEIFTRVRYFHQPQKYILVCNSTDRKITYSFPVSEPAHFDCRGSSELSFNLFKLLVKKIEIFEIHQNWFSNLKQASGGAPRPICSRC